jgi:uncharacterized protein with PIN domain
MKPADDPTSLGSILVTLGMITADQLAAVIELQERATLDHLIGRLAVAEGLITADQLDEALSAQAGLRSSSRSRRALAQAKIVELSAAIVTRCATMLKTRAVEIRRSRTGQGHAAISPVMMAAKGDE